MTDEKPYYIEMEDRGEYLWVLVGGPRLTAQIASQYWREIAEKCFELDRMKIMIEKDFIEPVSPAEMIQMAAYVGELLPTRKIAFLDRQAHDSINELGKKLARNRDVMMQIFHDTADAEKWLHAN
jgi:hypothetical protein